MDKEELKGRIADLIEMEARSGSMGPALIMPEYVFRMFGGTVPLEEIEEVMEKQLCHSEVSFMAHVNSAAISSGPAWVGRAYNKHFGPMIL